MPKIKNKKIYFTRNEIKKLPKLLQKEFIANGGYASIRERSDLRYRGSYEIRYRKNGYNISGSGKTILEAVNQFIIHSERAVKRDTAVKELEPNIDVANTPVNVGVPTTFTEFMIYYFEKFRKRRVAAVTYENDLYRCKRHIFPRFQSMQIAEITYEMIQEFIDERTDSVSVKIAKEVNSLLSGMFDYAVEQKLIDRNPCKLVITESYESKHGVALSFEEEDRLIKSLKGTKYLIPIAVALYTGLRPCEYRTAVIDGDFIKARNCKQKSKKPAYKLIPIIPRLRAILGDETEIYFPDKKYLNEKLKAVCPNHKLYDLRTTFNSRCEYFKVADFARKTWMGHGLEKLRKTYGSLPSEWFLEEAKKLDY